MNWCTKNQYELETEQFLTKGMYFLKQPSSQPPKIRFCFEHWSLSGRPVLRPVCAIGKAFHSCIGFKISAGKSLLMVAIWVSKVREFTT